MSLLLLDKSTETGCINYDTLDVTINNGFAPDKNNIIKSEFSEMLTCNDNSMGINYQWGYNSINSSDSLLTLPIHYNLYIMKISTIT